MLQDRISGPLRHSSPLVLLPTSSRRLGRSVARSSRLVSYTPVAYRRLGEFRSNRPKRDHVSPALGIARPERSACVTCERTHVISPSCTESRTGADKAGDCAGPRLCSTTTRTVRPLPSQRRRSRPRPQLHSASPSGPTARPNRLFFQRQLVCELHEPLDGGGGGSGSRRPRRRLRLGVGNGVPVPLDSAASSSPLEWIRRRGGSPCRRPHPPPCPPQCGPVRARSVKREPRVRHGG